MSTARRYLKNATVIDYTVTAGEAATKGFLALLASDTTANNAGAASDLGVGVFLETAVAGARVPVAMCNGVFPVEVGTGGATRGTKAEWVADGFTDADAHDSDGTGNDAIYGVFLESGSAGDIVGMAWYPSNRGF